MQEALTVRADMEQMRKQDKAINDHNGKPHLSVKTAGILFFLPKGGVSDLKKRAAAGFILRFGGLGILPNKRPDGCYWPSGHCLLILSERSDNGK